MLEEQKNDDNDPVAPEGSDAGPGHQEKKNIKKYLSHDGLFRFAFENKNVAESFARENLPGDGIQIYFPTGDHVPVERYI